MFGRRAVRARFVMPVALGLGLGMAGGVAVAQTAPEEAGAEADPGVSLSIMFTGVKPDGQPILFAVYTSGEKWLETGGSFYKSRVAASGSEVLVTVPGIPPGPVAVSVHHDENDNGKMDLFLGLLPTEGYGISNNPVLTGKPTFEEAVFTLPNEGGSVTIEMKY